MKGTSLKYLTHEGFRNVWVNRLMSLASVTVLMACLIIMGAGIMIYFNINNVDVDAVFLEVQGDNPDYGVNKAYHMVGNTLYWHNFYTLKPNMQILIRWKE